MNLRTSIISLLLAATTLPALAHFRTYTKEELNLLEELIQFDHETNHDIEGSLSCLGNLPPTNTYPWPSQQQFLERLRAIEKHQKTSLILVRGPRCESPLRDGAWLSQSFYAAEYFTGQYYKKLSMNMNPVYKTLRWAEDFGSYYIATLNLKPSREFYRFVMKFPAHELYDMGYEIIQEVPFVESEEGFAYSFPRTPRLFKK